jgi:hypothetical protein
MTPTNPISIALGADKSVRMIVTDKELDLTPEAARNLAAALTAFAEIARLSQEADE